MSEPIHIITERNKTPAESRAIIIAAFIEAFKDAPYKVEESAFDGRVNDCYEAFEDGAGEEGETLAQYAKGYAEDEREFVEDWMEAASAQLAVPVDGLTVLGFDCNVSCYLSCRAGLYDLVKVGHGVEDGSQIAEFTDRDGDRVHIYSETANIV